MSPLHEYCLRPFLADASRALEARGPVGRCICANCEPHQLRLEAWHIRWARPPAAGPRETALEALISVGKR